ncbi:MAG: AAA family ATPase [Chloroflexota bacterium]|nr:AAA family ATPase [Chloroflexota bacterium]
MTEIKAEVKDLSWSDSRQDPILSSGYETPRPEGGVYASEVEPEDVVWRSRGRVAAGKHTDLTGNPGWGKSTLTLDWAARYTRGWPLPDGDPMEPQGVVLLSAEDGAADTIRPRLEAAGADLDRVVIMTAKADGSLPSVPADIPLIEDWVRKVGAGLVVIDPLMAYLGREINAHRDQDVRRALAPLALMAQRTHCSLVTVRHLNKSQGTDALYRGGGSIGIVGAARIGLLVAPDPDDPDARVLAATKANLARLPDSLQFRLMPVEGTSVARIQYEGASRYSADDLVASERPRRTESQLDQAVAWLRQVLSAGPLTSVEILGLAAQAGVSDATLRRAKKAAGVRAVKSGFGDGSGWIWELGEASQVEP